MCIQVATPVDTRKVKSHWNTWYILVLQIVFPKSISDAWVLVWFIFPRGEQHFSDERVDGRETVGNSLGRAVGTGFTQSSFYTRSFTRQMFYTEKLVHMEEFTHRIFYTENFYTGKVLHTEAFTQRSLCTG